jgi:hypothetical protein
MGQQYLMEYVSKFYMNHTYAICHVCMMNFYIFKNLGCYITCRHLSLLLWEQPGIQARKHMSSMLENVPDVLLVRL